MPCSVDFDYKGNVAALLNEHVQNHNRHQLGFELNLREYKNTTSFNADAPWLYPAPRSFRPEVSLSPGVTFVKGSNYDSQKNKFVDKFEESNANAILHTLENSTTIYRNAEWMASLRGDRKERKDKSKSPKKQ